MAEDRPVTRSDVFFIALLIGLLYTLTQFAYFNPNFKRIEAMQPCAQREGK